MHKIKLDSLVHPVSFTAGLYWQPCNIMFLFTGKKVPVWWVWEAIRPQERPTGAHTGSAHWYSLQMWRLPKVEVFYSERNLNRHKAANHTDITYTCETCKNTYLYKSTLARHLRTCKPIVWTFLWTLWDIHFYYLRFIIDIALVLHFFSY